MSGIPLQKLHDIHEDAQKPRKQLPMKATLQQNFEFHDIVFIPFNQYLEAEMSY